MKIPNLKIPVTIDASGLEGDLRKAEARMKASAKRVSQMRAAATPAFGALGGGALGGVAGGLSQLGAGGTIAGAGAMALAAPMLIAERVISAFSEATRGSTEALRQFRETGINTTQMNTVMLEILSSMESRAQKLADAPSVFQSFLTGTGGEMNSILQWAKEFMEGLRALSAGIGAITSGKSFGEAFLAMQLPAANESYAQQLRTEMDKRAAVRERFQAVGGDALGQFAPDLAPFGIQLGAWLVRSLT